MYTYDNELEKRLVKDKIEQAREVWLPFLLIEQREAWHESESGQVENYSDEQARIEELSCS